MYNDEAKALKEVAKFGKKALEVSEKLGGFISKVFGTVPSDIIGVIGGDWLHHIRIRNAAKLAKRTEEILRERGILEKTEPMSPSVALPLLHAAQDETREQLREMWSRMLANGMDPIRSKSVRRSIIDTVKQLDPLDAMILQMVFNNTEIKDLPKQLRVSEDELKLSLKNLFKLECIDGVTSTSERIISISLSPLGREVMRACSL